jgi:hypothetical protein
MLTPRVPDHVSHPGRCITDAYRSDSMTRPTVIRRSQRLAVANSSPGGRERASRKRDVYIGLQPALCLSYSRQLRSRMPQDGRCRSAMDDPTCRYSPRHSHPPAQANCGFRRETTGGRGYITFQKRFRSQSAALRVPEGFGTNFYFLHSSRPEPCITAVATSGSSTCPRLH